MVDGDEGREGSRGAVDPEFLPVRQMLDTYLASDDHYGAQLSAYWRGREVVNLWGGPKVTQTSLTGVFSAGKGVAGLCIALLIQSGRLSLDQTVSSYWPEFGNAGKSDITVRQVLSHQAGVVGVPGGFSVGELSTGADARRRLAAIAPAWRPGALHGYHAITIGMLMEELVLRVTGLSLQDFYASEMRDPLGVDVYLGLPEAEDGRFVEVEPAVLTAEQVVEIESRQIWPDSLASWAMNQNGPVYTNGVRGELSPNIRSIRAYGGAGHAAVANGQGLARLYSAMISDVGAPRRLSPSTVTEVSTVQRSGIDYILGVEMTFGIVFMKPNSRLPFGSHEAFGHDGAGGALGFADPQHDLGFGYVPYPMQYPGGADRRAIQLSALIRNIISASTSASNQEAGRR
jgi:CubicO group peptidase (beta-lactamase class C family)